MIKNKGIKSIHKEYTPYYERNICDMEYIFLIFILVNCFIVYSTATTSTLYDRMIDDQEQEKFLKEQKIKNFCNYSA